MPVSVLAENVGIQHKREHREMPLLELRTAPNDHYRADKGLGKRLAAHRQRAMASDDVATFCATTGVYAVQ